MKFKWAWSDAPATLEDLQKSVGPGWSKLIEQLCEDLFALGWNGDVEQVKEKFGGLRFYLSYEGIPEKFRRIAGHVEWWYENQSLMVCDQCGGPGCTRGPGWIRTLCREHALKAGYNLKGHEK